MKRVLGVIEGKEDGPLNILLGGLHGNEVAGIKAINEIFFQIHLHKIPIRGTIVGLAGNLQAIAKNKRFIDYDLNRCWTDDFVDKVYHKQHSLAEDIELKSLHQQILDPKYRDFSTRILVDLPHYKFRKRKLHCGSGVKSYQSNGTKSAATNCD